MNIIDSLREVGIKQLPQSVLENEELQAWYASILQTGGAEIPESDWAEVEKLEKAGLITLTGAHGPGKSWKRATPITDPPGTIPTCGEPGFVDMENTFIETPAYCSCEQPDMVGRKGEPNTWRCLKCGQHASTDLKIAVQFIGMDSTKKIAAMSQIVANHFASDPSRASLVISWLENDKFYMSVVRYHGKYGADKEVVLKCMNKNFDDCFQNLVMEWRKLTE